MQSYNPAFHSISQHPFASHQLLYLPGVVDKEAFLERCEGCLKCAAACPHGAISWIETEPGVRFPFIDPAEAPCRLCPDMPCSHACPTGGLKAIAPEAVRMGKAMLDPVRCRCLTTDTICSICYDTCPLKDRAIIWDDDINAPLINMRFCTGCGVCVFNCPAPEKPLMIFPA